MTIGFTEHLLMWRLPLRGCRSTSACNQWGKTDTLWIDK